MDLPAGDGSLKTNGVVDPTMGGIHQNMCLPTVSGTIPNDTQLTYEALQRQSHYGHQ